MFELDKFSFDMGRAEMQLSEDIDSVTEWCAKLYDCTFSEYFSEVHSLYERLESEDRPINTEELSYILIKLPLRLTEVSEKLNTLSVKRETVKMRNDFDKLAIFYDMRNNEMSIEDSNNESKMQLMERKLLVTAYTSVITRVEQEISFSRELIMGAKKIWDSRASAVDLGIKTPHIDSSTGSLPTSTNSGAANGVANRYSREDIIGRG